VKHENRSSIGSFKARGSPALSAHIRECRVVACITGKHGMGVAYAARLLGLQATVVPERELVHAIRILLRYTHNLAEGAGTAALADGLKDREALAAREVALILSGGSRDTQLLPSLLQEGDAAAAREGQPGDPHAVQWGTLAALRGPSSPGAASHLVGLITHMRRRLLASGWRWEP
jgi:threonine dehydratase